MALPESGTISLSDIQTEFGGSNPISISEYYGVAAGVPTSGTISFSDFHGTSAIAFPEVGWSGNTIAVAFWFGYGDMSIGWNVSGAAFRQQAGVTVFNYGQWMTVNSDSTITPTGLSQADIWALIGNYIGFETSGTMARHYDIWNDVKTNGAWSTMESANGFSIDSLDGIIGWEVSGTLQRAVNASYGVQTYGNWISIT